MEIWKPIKGFEENYEISNLGRVKSLARIIKYRNNVRHRGEQMIKVCYTWNGTPMVTLSRDKIKYSRSVPKIVREHFEVIKDE